MSVGALGRKVGSGTFSRGRTLGLDESAKETLKKSRCYLYYSATCYYTASSYNIVRAYKQ